jgi:hypothetical protein
MLTSPLHGDRGSSLMLMPAAVLVVLILGAIAADFSHVHNRKRELIAVANSIAQDAATYGLDVDSLRETTGTGLPYDDQRLKEVIDTSIAAHTNPDRPIQFGDYKVVRDTTADTVTVTVTLRDDVEYVFAKAVPGVDDSRPIEARGIAVAEED